MAVCQICGKGPQFGNNVSFSQRHTRRQFKPNIHKTKIMQGGKLVTVKVCTRCLKTLAKDAV